MFIYFLPFANICTIRTAFTHHEMVEAFSFNESDEFQVKDILLPREEAHIPVICLKRKRWVGGSAF